MACPHLLVCHYYNDRLDNMPGGSNLQKIHFCENRRDKCARAMVADVLGVSSVPDDLMPYEVERARKLLVHFVQKRRQGGRER